MSRHKLTPAWDERVLVTQFVLVRRIMSVGVGTIAILVSVSIDSPPADAQGFDRGGRPLAQQRDRSSPRKVMRYRNNVELAQPGHVGGPPRWGAGWGVPLRGRGLGYPLWRIPNFGYPGVGFPIAPSFGPPWGPLSPIGFPGWQQPVPLFSPVLTPGSWFPPSVMIQSHVVANPPLPPAEITLANSGARELQVGIADRANPNQAFSTRIPAGGESTVSLQRESGAIRTARYQTYDTWGYPIVQEVVTEIAPSVRYEVVVHEWAIQSIAIDRTGKSPNPIEDVNFQGRGIGRFPLPAGEELISGTIDVYRAAIAAQNRGAVAPLIPTDQHQASDKPSILERAILDAQRRATQNR